MTFEKFPLHASLLRGVRTAGYSKPTPIQVQAVPVILSGRDLMGIAQTGTGKTAAFALPILSNLQSRRPVLHSSQRTRSVRSLVLTPTRELALQVGESFKSYGIHTMLKTVVVFGGVSIEPQKKALSGATDVLVATPGRLLDLVSQRQVDLSRVEIFVLDEADRMFDMGFIRDIRKVIALLPKERQTLMFSATMPTEIARLATSVLTQPKTVQIASKKTTADNVKQSVFYVDGKQKIPLLKHLVKSQTIERAIVFVRMKYLANRIADNLRTSGIESEAFHSNKSQNARQRALEGFKTGKVRVLVATDIAARGLDIDGIEVVVNYDLPDLPETYVHRIGRTGRADAHGLAWSFCDRDQRHLLKNIEKSTRQTLEVAGLPTLPTQ